MKNKNHGGLLIQFVEGMGNFETPEDFLATLDYENLRDCDLTIQGVPFHMSVINGLPDLKLVEE